MDEVEKPWHKWEREFPQLYRCADVLCETACGGSWQKRRGPGTDFVCSVCGRGCDTKWGAWRLGKSVRVKISQAPWDLYPAATVLALRTREGDELAFLRGDGRVIERHAASAAGTKEYGDTDYYVIETETWATLFTGLLGLSVG